MTCYYPLTAYRSSERHPSTGKRGLVFRANDPRRLVEGSSLSVPCGRCIGCRLDKSGEWAVRCMHEAQFHAENCFLTLTYDAKCLPADYSVSVETHQKFIRALRDRIGRRIRFFACGEYGSEDGSHPYQPHYHYLIFGYRPYDLKKYTTKIVNNKKTTTYTSDLISDVWSNGHCTVGDVTYSSAAYCARYVVKKIGGELAADHYLRIHPVTGSLCRVLPEFAKMSLKPGIGDAWFETFKSDVFPSDFCVVEGHKRPVPRFYFRKLEEEEARKVNIRRKAAGRKNRADKTSARLRVREQVVLSRVKLLKREI